MKTKIVYALVSDASDFYLEQTLLSVYSLRMYNPNVWVELVVDKLTYDGLVNNRTKIKEYVDQVHVVKTPDEFNSVQKSRFLKTNLRDFVKGNFLFLDCDTIICDLLDDADEIDAEIAMVADMNGNLLLSDDSILKRCKEAGFGDAKGYPYFNSGVIYAKDTPLVHLFYHVWYENWLLSNSRGVKYDQPALCTTNMVNGNIIKELDGIWNCQFKMKGYSFMNNAKILHYYSNNGKNDSSLIYPINLLCQIIREEGVTLQIENFIKAEKSELYAFMTVTKEQFFSFANSHFLFLYTNRPSLYYSLERIGRVLERIIYKSRGM